MVGRAIQRGVARERVCTALAAGNTRRAACAFAGISEDTLANWLRRHSEFADAVQKAEGDAEVRNVAIISRAAQQGTWQAAAWWLERRYPHDYGRTIQEQHHSGTVVQEHTGVVEVRAVDYRHSIRALAPLPPADAGADDLEDAG
jgi:hypothetical protein